MNPNPARILRRLPSALRKAICLALATGTLSAANAQTESRIQSSAKPFGLDIAAPVMMAGSDDASAQFQKEVLPDLTKMLNGTLGESANVDDAAISLDPSKLTLKTASDVRVYFIGEGAGYQNTLGFDTTGGGVSAKDAALIFPNASSPVSTYDPNRTGKRTASAPLLPGDFVDLGKFEAGTFLDFFLIADGAGGGRTSYSADASSNPDGINHVVSFAWAVPGSSLLIIGFEDLFGGGDRDFNDLLFAVDIGASNMAALTGTPEPAMLLTFGTFLGGVVLLKRRRGVAPHSFTPRTA